MIDWQNFDARRFERVVAILVHDVFGATAIDGAGGDEAQDLRLEGPGGVIIYEVKSFTGRLAAGQRRQVKRSFQRAVDLHDPVEWILITRSNPTPDELRWLKSLVPSGGQRVRWLGVEWLDNQIASCTDRGR